MGACASSLRKRAKLERDSPKGLKSSSGFDSLMNTKGKKKKMKEKKENSNMVSEPMAMTYGMSDNLVNSGLLTQIRDLSTADKRCLIGYITQELAYEETDDDVDWRAIDSNLPPYTLDELYARIDESHQQYLRGEYITAEESDAKLKEDYILL